MRARAELKPALFSYEAPPGLDEAVELLHTYGPDASLLAGGQSLMPMLYEATRHIGHRAIRNRGTIGGSLAHADPAAEYPAAALAVDRAWSSIA